MGRRTVAPARGQVWLARVGLTEAKRFVIVSNNERNRVLQDVLGVRLTTASKPDLPSIVAFQPGEIGSSRTAAVADDVWLLRKDDLVRSVGAFSRGQMARVDAALKVALDLD